MYRIMRTLLVTSLTGLFLLLAGVGCGSRAQKDINKDKDRPKLAEKEAARTVPEQPALEAVSLVPFYSLGRSIGSSPR